MVRITELDEIPEVTEDDVLAISDVTEDKDRKVKVTDLVTNNDAVVLNTSKISYTDAVAVGLNTAKISYTDAVAVGLNTAKISFTEQAAVGLNTAKISFTEQAAVTANTAKISFTEQAAVTANTAKVGITTAQANNIIANNAKISYTDEVAVGLNTAKISYTDSAAVGLNTAKVGITPAQASAIVDNTAKISFDSTSSTKLGTIAENAEVNVQSDWNAITGDSFILNKPSIVGAPVDSVFGRTGSVIATSGDYDTSEVTENTNLYYTDVRVTANSAVGLNTAKISFTEQAAVTANTNKISYTDAVAVGLNTDKISYTDAVAVGLNTAKISFTEQAAVTANTNKISYTDAVAVGLNTAKISFDTTSSTRLADTSGANTGDQNIPVSGTDFDPVGTDNSDNNAINTLYSGLISYPGSANATELNILDGATLTTTELNYVNGVTSAIQTQLTAKGTMSNLSEDATPTLGGELDGAAHSIGFTAQTATGDGTTTINWGSGNKMHFTFGAANETFTFTAPSKPGNFLLKMVQDGTGSRTATWPATVKWAGGTAPTLTTTASAIDIISFYFDGTNYYGVASLAFA